MTTDAILRCAAVAVAAAIVLAPYRKTIAGWASRGLEAAKAEAATIGRIAAALLIVAAMWGKIPLPTLPAVNVPSIEVETPSDEMQRLVAPIGAALANLDPASRALWASTWSKAALVVSGDAVSTEIAFTDTRSLRLFTTLAVDIAWRRIGGHQPGSVAGLREAVEAAYGQAIGTTVQPVDKSVRDRFVEFCKAVAWAGVNRG